MKKLLSILLTLLLVVLPSLTGCSSGSTSNSAKSSTSETEYADDAFIKSLSKGLEKRWSLNDDYNIKLANGTIKDGSSEQKEAFESWVNTELDEIEKYRNEPFENADLQQTALAYINALNDQRNALDEWGTDKFSEDWSKAYDERTRLLAELADNYNLTVSDKYKDQLDSMKASGKQVQSKEDETDAVKALADSFSFEQTADDYGYKTYTATVENNSGYNLKYFYADISLLNNDGTLVETQYADAENWQNGQKAQFEFTTDADFTTTSLTIDSWEDDQGNSSYN